MIKVIIGENEISKRPYVGNQIIVHKFLEPKFGQISNKATQNHMHYLRNRQEQNAQAVHVRPVASMILRSQLIG